jgi:hypothetical protein
MFILITVIPLGSILLPVGVVLFAAALGLLVLGGKCREGLQKKKRPSEDY